MYSARACPSHSPKRSASGAAMKVPLCIAILASSLSMTSRYAHEHSVQARLTRDEAMRMARQAATAKGYDLKNFSLLQYKDDLSKDGKEWFFLFVCKQPAPGCAFSASINRETGAVEISPGE